MVPINSRAPSGSYSKILFGERIEYVLIGPYWQIWLCRDNDVEFGKVSGIDGLYIANRLQNGVKQSLITFNQGGSWSPLLINDSCADCTLNLYSPSSDLKDHFYSRHTAPGLIIATGNVGLSLNKEQSAANTYLSRDAGLTWKLLAAGSHLVGFSNFGSLILMVDDMAAIDSVQYVNWT